MKIVIPTYKRPQGLLSLKLAEQIVGAENVWIFFHDEEDLNNYKKNYEIRNYVVTNNPRGITKQRNSILNHFNKNEEIVMLDDDISCFYKLVNNKLEQLNPEQIKEIFKEFFTKIRQEKCFVWGIYPVNNEYFMSNNIDWEALNIGCTLGIINNELRFDEGLNSKEDYDFCLQNIKKYGKSARFNYITCKAKHQQKNLKDGGCAWIYQESWGDDYKKLLNKWQDVIKPNPKRHNEVLIRNNIRLIAQSNQGRLI